MTTSENVQVRWWLTRTEKRLLGCLLVAVAVTTLSFTIYYTNNVVSSSKSELVTTSITSIHSTIQPQIFWAPNDTSKLCILNNDEDGEGNSSSSFQLLLDKNRNVPSNNGLLLVRIPKTGSSTIGGVAGRIAHAMASHKYYHHHPPASFSFCKSRVTHAWSLAQLKRFGSFRTRNKTTSFLWTFLRDPAHRALSGYFFFAVGKHHNKRVKDAIPILRKTPNQHCKWVGCDSSSKRKKKKDEASPQHCIQKVLQEFNFIGLLERLDESLVVLQLLLQLQPQDVLYLQGAKQSGSYDISNKCFATPSIQRTPTLDQYFASEEWFHNNHCDYLLYHAVHQSLDATIEYSIGRTKFDIALQKFQSLKAYAQSKCHYKSPCIGDGIVRPINEPGTKCYAEDWGCGYECLDDLFANDTSYH